MVIRFIGFNAEFGLGRYSGIPPKVAKTQETKKVFLESTFRAERAPRKVEPYGRKKRPKVA
jgi:hypothetical protein